MIGERAARRNESPGVKSLACRLATLREPAGKIARYTSMVPYTWWM